MLNINNFTLAGLIGSEIILRKSNDGVYTYFNVQTDDIEIDDEGKSVPVVFWHKCYATNEIAQYLHENCKIGTQIYLTGTLKPVMQELENGEKIPAIQLHVLGGQVIADEKIPDFADSLDIDDLIEVEPNDAPAAPNDTPTAVNDLYDDEESLALSDEEDAAADATEDSSKDEDEDDSVENSKEW